MVLVDTSVWIRALVYNSPYKPELDRLLGLDQVLGHELVFGEIFIGDRGGRRHMLNFYEQMQYAKPVPHKDVVDLVRQRRLHGRGAGWIDIQLLASAIAAGAELWTADPRLRSIAEEHGIAYATA